MSPYSTRTRSGKLPEDRGYTDTGCNLYPHCLTCPFPDCLTHTPHGTLSFRHSLYVLAVQRLVRKGLSVPDISHQTGIAIRVVYRIKERLTRRGNIRRITPG
jgi:hypothetical protein